MTLMRHGVAGHAEALEGIETRLADHLNSTAVEVAHVECFDPEQRAEVYAILGALQSDTRAHKKAIQFISTRLSEGGDA
jgi:hypothetical protein